MAGKAISIDHAANGLLRHRFVRAVSAAWMVVILLFLLAVTVAAAADTAMHDPDSQITNAGDAAGMVVVVLIVFAGLVLGAALFAGVFGALFDALHRRFVAFIMLIIMAPATLLIGYVAIAFLGTLVGLQENINFDTNRPYQLYELVAMTISYIVSTIIAAEWTGWAWWQLITSRRGFFAARGWRPPIWHVFATFRRQLGLPAFISNFGRGRMALTFIYFLAALMNVGLVASFAAPVFVLGIEQGQDLALPLALATAFAGLVVLNIFRVGIVLDRWGDATATRLYQKARDWDGRAPVIFLRDFDQDDAKLQARALDPLVRLPAGVGGARTLDELLLEHASPYGPVIAIGDPRTPTPPLGAARVFVEGAGNEWQDVVRQLMSASSLVILCPSDSAGVQWELNLVGGADARLRVLYLANPELPREANIALFEKLAPPGEARELKRRHAPVAAYKDPDHRWRVLSSSRKPCVQTYTIGINYALHDLLGHEGAPLKRAKKQRAT